MLVKTSDIECSDRARSDYGDIKGLSASIVKYGIICPLLVEETPQAKKPYKLVAGGRRYRAALAAGLKEVPVATRATLSPLLRLELELEENIRRKNLLWSEEVALKDKLFTIKQREHQARGETFTLQDTAELLHESLGAVSQDITLARAMKQNPELKLELLKYPKTTAFKIVKQREEEAMRERLLGSIDNLKVEFHLGDCTELIKNLADASVDLVVTDPPFAVPKIEESCGSYGALTGETHNSTFEKMREIYTTIIPELFRVLKPGAHCYMFFANELYGFLMDVFKLSGFEVDPIPIIWDKTRTTTPFTGYYYQRCYEPIIYAVKPPRNGRRLHEAAPNILKFKPLVSKAKAHVFHKPPELIEFLIQQSSVRGDFVLDPFAGSGQTLKSAEKLERHAVGFELDPATYARACEYMMIEEGTQ